jgi:beta-lactam-binding protein with PASTA domain
VAGLPQEQAIDEMEDADLRVNLERENSDEIAAGNAIRTVPRAGVEVERGTRITLFVSEGPEQVAVPDVIGLSSDSAELRLRAEGLAVAVQEQESEEAEGTVIAQTPGGGAQVDVGTTVTITVSIGIQRVSVPGVIGLTPRDAEAEIGAAGLSASRTERTVTDPAQDGVVVAQRPGAGVELEPGGQVVIVVGVLQPEEEIQPIPPEDQPQEQQQEEEEPEAP